MAKKITGHRYYEWYYDISCKRHELPNGWLFVDKPKRYYATHITKEDLPESFIQTIYYMRHGWIDTANVSDLYYRGDPLPNHWLKDSMLYITYDGKKLNRDDGFWNYKADDFLWGYDILRFVFAVEKYSPQIDLTDIKQGIIDSYNLYADHENEMGFHEHMEHINSLDEWREKI